MTYVTSLDLGNGEGLEDIIRPETRPRKLKVHLEAGVIQAGRPQTPVNHVNLKLMCPKIMKIKLATL